MKQQQRLFFRISRINLPLPFICIKEVPGGGGGGSGLPTIEDWDPIFLGRVLERLRPPPLKDSLGDNAGGPVKNIIVVKNWIFYTTHVKASTNETRFFFENNPIFFLQMQFCLIYNS